jgi:catechol 2,3-dioxygenase-like lactoylglutathione lyase family enzyme
MTSWLGQYCLNVTDLERSVAFYTSFGLTCTSRTEIPDALEAIVENPSGGSKFQMAQQKNQSGRLDLGTGFWKLYVNTHDVDATFRTALTQGATAESPPQRMERWPVSVAFVRDPDGYMVELVTRHPWPDGVPSDGPWLGQYCINVTDIEASIKFFELMELECTSRTEIEHAHEAILENPKKGSKLQLAQQLDQDGQIRMGSMWKLYVNTEDCKGLHDAAVRAGYPSVVEPLRLERWPVTMAFVAAPDGYQVELVQHHS